MLLGIFFTTLFFVLGGVWRVWSGGWGPHATRHLRLFIGGSLAGLHAYLSTGSLWALGVVPIFHLAMVPGHGSYQDMGRMPGPDNERWTAMILDLFFDSRASSFERDFPGMLLRYGLASLAIGLYLIFGVGVAWTWTLIYIAFGLLPGCVYALAYFFKVPVTKGRGSFLEGPTRYGEFAIGSVLIGGLGLFWFV